MSLYRPQRPLMAVLALLGGLLYPLAFAPYDFWPLVLLSIALAWWTLGATAKQAFWRGWLYGLGLFGFGVSWLHVSMHDYGDTPLWLAVPMTALFAAFLALFPALLAALTVKFSRGRPSPLLFAGGWLLLDVLRGALLTGFPWLYAGYALIDTPLVAAAPLGGVWLMTLIAVLAGLTLALAWQRRPSAFVTGALLLLGGATPLLPLERFIEPAADAPTKVALVQGNIPQDLRWLATMRDATRDIYAGLTAEIGSDTLVVWPEAALTEFYDTAREFLAEQSALLAARDSALISGLPTRDWQGDGWRYYNSILVVEGGEGIYDKQKLVPFGEYVPLESLLRGLIPFFDLPMSSFTPGPAKQDNLLAQYMVVSPFICYEIVYPELVARQAADSNVMVTISNDAWFGHSAGPHQHFQMARLRAAETGRYLLRATNNGITAIIDERGVVQGQLPQFERAVLEGSFMPFSGSTPFVRWGGAPVWWLAALLCGVGLLARRR
ncbi:apolipoprotein N-acyltransferase [Isoalcanivorax beigongshangi]|uniref:Apolipoprotein N-acyltransferase n=1 Tax=Isoalcanivorax beigongshangi TaxID=3238810 RepID=A0ABV4AHL3_9GAMM